MLADLYVCQRPPPNALLWRYMDLPRFMSLLHTRSLFFVRADRLGDPFEGSITSPTQQERIRFAESLGEPHCARVLRALQSLKNLRTWFAVSCWHENPHESEAMWGLYATRNAGVAIRSTARRLFQACGASPRPIYVSRVKYIDYAKDTIPSDNTFWPYLRKRKSFEHEREVRALILNDDPIDGDMLVPVSIESLVEAVILSPLAPNWFLEAVKYVVERCGLHLPVLQSSLILPPLF